MNDFENSKGRKQENREEAETEEKAESKKLVFGKPLEETDIQLYKIQILYN